MLFMVKGTSSVAANEAVQSVRGEIIRLIESFCREHLNDEYAVLCCRLTDKLVRKRPSPLLTGRPSAWATGIVRTIGWINFLGDKSQTPHMRVADIDAYFGVTSSTGATKLKAIRQMLDTYPFDPEWTLPSRIDDNPLVWLAEINGFPVDLRHMPREVQEVAFDKGLIPYIPADRHPPNG
jgi:hypothetical protein